MGSIFDVLEMKLINQLSYYFDLWADIVICYEKSKHTKVMQSI